jgi:predicted aspartyl protease
MIYGYFSTDANLPYVHISVVFAGTTVDSAFVIDTGFSGDLKINGDTANELGIIEADGTDFVNANGEVVSAGFVNGYAEMEGRKASIKIIIVNGSQLAGMSLFSAFGYEIVVNCKSRTARLERVG